MPKEQEVLKPIPALYKTNALNLLAFAYIRGVRETVHTVTEKQAIKMFMNSFELEEDEFNLDSALFTYSRTKKKETSRKRK